MGNKSTETNRQASSLEEKKETEFDDAAERRKTFGGSVLLLLLSHFHRLLLRLNPRSRHSGQWSGCYIVIQEFLVGKVVSGVARDERVA